MALQPSVTVVEVTGDDDDEWGDEEEVVVWSNDIHDTAAAAAAEAAATADLSDSLHQPHSNGSAGDGGGSGGKRDQGGHPLLIASLANLAISYNVVRGRAEQPAVVPYNTQNTPCASYARYCFCK